jgi:hypothetical protein
VSDPTVIPQDIRAELCQMALDAQAACLAAFDAIESGDLASTALATSTAATKALELNTAIKPLAALALLRLQRGLGINFGEVNR